MKVNSIMVKTISIIMGLFGLMINICADHTSLVGNLRQTKSYAKKNLPAEVYYDMALKGELMNTQTKKDSFLFSFLKRIGNKAGICQGGVYEDPKGNVWFVKEASSPINEYLGAKIMDLLIGHFSPEISLFADQPKLTASKLLPGFITGYELTDDKPIIGKLELEIAMQIIGLDDRNEGNQGYIDLGEKFHAARVDFDHSFSFGSGFKMLSHSQRLSDLTLTDFEEAELAIKRISTIPDENILYVLADAYNNLWEAGIPLNDYENSLKDLGKKLIDRKNQNFTQHLFNIFCYSSELEIIELLLENGADPNEAFSSICNVGDLDAVKLLLKYGANPKNSEALDFAVHRGHFDIVKLLLEYGADPKTDNSKVLNFAAQRGHFDVFKLLLENGADPKKVKPHVFFLHMPGHAEIMKLLLERLSCSYSEWKQSHMRRM